jgi:hypothetical protein
MLYMHNVTLTENGQKKKIGQLLEVVLTPPMEGGVRTTSRSCQWRIQFVISTSSYVKLVEMTVSEEWEDSFFGDGRKSLFWPKSNGCHDVNIMGYDDVDIMVATSLGLSHMTWKLMLWYRLFCFFSASLFYVLIWFIFLFAFSDDKRRALSESHAKEPSMMPSQSPSMIPLQVPSKEPSMMPLQSALQDSFAKSVQNALEWAVQDALFRPVAIHDAIAGPLQGSFHDAFAVVIQAAVNDAIKAALQRPPESHLRIHWRCRPFVDRFLKERGTFLLVGLFQPSPFFLALTSIFTSMYFF